MKIVITRKEHKCWGCATKFPKGSHLSVNTSFEEGPKTTYWCDPCAKYWDAYSCEFRDGIYQGDFRGEQHYEEFKAALNKTSTPDKQQDTLPESGKSTTE